MLAEIFMLKIETQARAAMAEEARPRFVPAARRTAEAGEQVRHPDVRSPSRPDRPSNPNLGLNEAAA